MARPQKTDRNTVATDTLTLRLTSADRATLDSLVAAKAAELATMGVELTAASYVRGLIRQEASRSLSATSEAGRSLSTVQVAAPLAERRATPRPETPTENNVRAMLDNVLAKGIKKAEVCRLSGVDAAQLHRWINRKMGLSPFKLSVLATTLEGLVHRGPQMPERVATRQELADEAARIQRAKAQKG
jgi:hypothetical protein